MVATTPWIEKTGTRLRGVAQYLKDNGGAAKKNDIYEWVETLLPPTDDELVLRKNGSTVWLNDVAWGTTNLVKAEWMTKDGKGYWTITEAGLQALEEFSDPSAYYRESNRLYNEWKKSVSKEPRRAWLIKGSSVMGVDLVPEWMAEGFCSLAASQLRNPGQEVTVSDLEAIAQEDYGHLPTQERKTRVDEIVSFVTKIRPDDIVVTTDAEKVFLGDVTGVWTFETSEGSRSNLRRKVDWRNQDAPIAFDELPEPLPARLQTGSTILDLTSDFSVIDGLTTVTPDPDPHPDPGIPGQAPRHEHLRAPTEALAAELFVSTQWLNEVRDLLDERRQIIFYGPPGTGKTYIARKLAADLVGAEQVKLVQFHPAYAYEDFFEGYRPMVGFGKGTIGFELKAGPLRQLVNRAREHPDQAFILIIDEINRANLAKVFGELYFLLEYRDQAVDLLYSADEEGFTLPKNFYLIGTMNTADRSIALFDGAMRRRFSFIELSPDIEPTKSLLAKWSEKHGLGDVAARLLSKLNSKIEDPDFRLGPSYFMSNTSPASGCSLHRTPHTYLEYLDIAFAAGTPLWRMGKRSVAVSIVSAAISRSGCR